MTLPGSVRPVALAGAVLVVAVAGYLKAYAWPRDALLAEIERQRSANAAYEAALNDYPRVKAGLKNMAAQTLGAQADEADARFRTLLGNIASSACGLTVVVNTVAPEKVSNPAGPKIKTPSSVKGELAKTPDFTVIRGELKGEGSLDQVMRTVAMVQKQPWVSRTESLTIAPLDKERQRFALTLGVATILMPDLAPKPSPEPKIRPLEPEATGAWAGIVAKNMFREPPMKVAKADPPPAPPAPPPAPVPPAWGEWKVTAVVETRRRVEAWVVNVKSGGSAVLNVGSTILGATFLGGSRESAVFEIGGQRYEVQIGQTLEQRSPVSK
jgi:hypothetical protein